MLYGMEAYSLSKNYEEAENFIKDYFSALEGVKDYFKRCHQQAQSQGYVTTLWGRPCFIHGIHSARKKKAAFRQAINAPLQGTCADIMKKAMIDCHHWLIANCPGTRLVLQIHDELLFETSGTFKKVDEEKNMSQLKNLILMKNVVSLRVPLKVTEKYQVFWSDPENSFFNIDSRQYDDVFSLS